MDNLILANGVRRLGDETAKPLPLGGEVVEIFLQECVIKKNKQINKWRAAFLRT